MVCIDNSGTQIAIDTHLFAWHPIKRETCANFRHPLDTFCNDNKLHNSNDGKYDQPNGEISSYDKLTESIHNITGIML
ncbi:Uncharacterised protein [Salmonella enterica subsp. enterica serovar Typhi]|nr:Uncharacterised protein [Salmonella enterica subsp. enterica serovar Typhi]CHT55082.1 Uncharacterised protein [Salmonella enterica subsp. enterica serovar Typhi]CHY50589.1 Uncharacterised protein [Salmonella enterica subsp. enterica serovar Typhi]CHY59013.1 Uncharacterised protein [Salmonella enterica subsp. enterica serovar Typhi]CQT49596.1 Uncharacterised protein [Salmonella enterica subsp. enterica serovar Typhi]